jgi:hypothetical protein
MPPLGTKSKNSTKAALRIGTVPLFRCDGHPSVGTTILDAVSRVKDRF